MNRYKYIYLFSQPCERDVSFTQSNKVNCRVCYISNCHCGSDRTTAGIDEMDFEGERNKKHLFFSILFGEKKGCVFWVESVYRGCRENMVNIS